MLEIKLHDNLKVVIYDNNTQIEYTKVSYKVAENAVILDDDTENQFAYVVNVGGTVLHIVNDLLDASTIKKGLVSRLKNYEECCEHKIYLDGVKYTDFHGKDVLKDMRFECHKAVLLASKAPTCSLDAFVNHLLRILDWADTNYVVWGLIQSEQKTYYVQQGIYGDIYTAINSVLSDIGYNSRGENNFREEIGFPKAEIDLRGH